MSICNQEKYVAFKHLPTHDQYQYEGSYQVCLLVFGIRLNLALTWQNIAKWKKEGYYIMSRLTRGRNLHSILLLSYLSLTCIYIATNCEEGILIEPYLYPHLQIYCRQL